MNAVYNYWAPSYWLNPRPEQLPGPYLLTLLITTIVLVIFWLIIKKKLKNKGCGSFIKICKLKSVFCLTNSFIILVFLSLDYELIPVLSARVWWLIWLITAIVWWVLIMKKKVQISRKLANKPLKVPDQYLPKKKP